MPIPVTELCVNAMLSLLVNTKPKLMSLMTNITCSGQHRKDFQCGIPKTTPPTAQPEAAVHTTHNAAEIPPR